MNENLMNQNDQILESLRPRMQAARVAHVRRVIAGVAVVPLLGFGAVAMAADGGSTSTEMEVAVAPIEETEPDAELPDIGDGGAEEAVETDDQAVEPVTVEPTPTTAAPDLDAPASLELGALGWVEVKPDADAYAVLSYDLTEGWEAINTEVVEGSLQILLSNGEVMKVVIITPGVRDEITVAIEDFVIPTTTVKPEPAPAEPKPSEPKDETPPPVAISDRFTVEVPGKGSFVVEREGDTLYLGAVTASEGYSSDIHKAEGWKVYVGFSNGETVYFGKALINDNGDVEQHFWEEQIGPVPTYEWVEIPGIGAAKFEMLEGQLRIYKTETAEGFESWDYNQGAYAATAKVDFEGEGQIWFIEASVNENGDLVSTTYQG